MRESLDRTNANIKCNMEKRERAGSALGRAEANVSKVESVGVVRGPMSIADK
jgi:hypothetical protein